MMAGFEVVARLDIGVDNGKGANHGIVAQPHLIARMGAYDLWMGFFKDSEDNVLSLMSELPPAPVTL